MDHLQTGPGAGTRARHRQSTAKAESSRDTSSRRESTKGPFVSKHQCLISNWVGGGGGREGAGRGHHWAPFMSRTLGPSFGPTLALVATQRFTEAPAWAHAFPPNRSEKAVGICPRWEKKVFLWQTLFENLLVLGEVAVGWIGAGPCVWGEGMAAVRSLPICWPESTRERGPRLAFLHIGTRNGCHTGALRCKIQLSSGFTQPLGAFVLTQL